MATEEIRLESFIHYFPVNIQNKFELGFHESKANQSTTAAPATDELLCVEVKLCSLRRYSLKQHGEENKFRNHRHKRVTWFSSLVWLLRADEALDEPLFKKDPEGTSQLTIFPQDMSEQS